jgi:biotin carboxyl carrier protein
MTGRATEHRYDAGGRERVVRVRALADGRLEVRVADGGGGGERAHVVEVARASDALLAVAIDGRRLAAYTATDRGVRLVALGGRVHRLAAPARTGRRGRGGAHDQAALSSPMPATVVRIEVAEGDRVAKGQLLVVVEAMKMAHEVRAPRPGRVVRVGCAKGALVEPNVPLIELGDDPGEGA